MANFGAEPIDPGLARKLDAFTIPALPGAFAERALAAALALPEGETTGVPPLPRQRRSLPRRWWRSGAFGLGAIAAGMISISAAAMGYFGEPVRLAIHEAPVIGKVIERVMPERTRRKPKLASERAVAKSVRPAPAPAASAPMAEEAQPAEPAAMLPSRWRNRAEVRRILADPEARKAWIAAHPEAARRIAERRAGRLERRQAIRAELRKRRIEAGIAPSAGPSAGPAIEGPAARPWRIERRERVRQWRERRRQMQEERLGPAEAPGPPATSPPLR